MAITATIQELLQGIMDSQYGRDMRQFIHDAIQKCYEDGKAGAIDIVAREKIADNTLSTDIINKLTFSVSQSVFSPIKDECYYYKTGATVVVHIGAKITGGDSYPWIAQLPEGYRPHKKTMYLVPHSDGFSKIIIESDGHISINVVGSGTANDQFELRFDVFEEST